MASSTKDLEYPTATGLPAENGSTSYWLARSKGQSLTGLNADAPLPEEVVDQVIIGSGIAGTVTAYSLLTPAELGTWDNAHRTSSTSANRPPGQPPRVVMLEAREISAGATGRNGGHVRPDAFASFPRFAATLGEEMAHKILVNERETLAYLARLVATEKIDCDFTPCTTIDTFLHPGAMEREHDAFLRYSKLGRIDPQVRFCDDAQEAQRVTRVKGALGMVSWPAASMYPYKFVIGLVSRLIERGLQVYTQAPVGFLKRLQDGTWEVALAPHEGQRGGKLRARQVLLATNAYTPHLATVFQGHIYPRRAWCSAIVPDKSFSGPLRRPGEDRYASQGILPYTLSLKTSKFGYEYFVPRPIETDGTWIFGGANGALTNDQVIQSSIDDSPGLAGTSAGGSQDSQTCDALKRVTKYFSSFPAKHFEGWNAGAGEGLERVWSGILGYTKDSLPFVGELPLVHVKDLQAPSSDGTTAINHSNLFVCAGFHGHGMARAATCARGVANLMLRSSNEELLPDLTESEWEQETLLPGAYRWDHKRAAQDLVDYRHTNLASDTDGEPLPKL